MNTRDELKLESITGTLLILGINIDRLRLKLLAYQDEPGAALAMEIGAKVSELQAHVESLLRKVAEVEA